MLSCRTIDGNRYLQRDISLSCETSEYRSLRDLAVFGVLLFPIGIVVLFTAAVGRQRHKLPPDWWPAEESARAKLAYAAYRKEEGRSFAKAFGAWKAEMWDPEMEKHQKMYDRFGFLFAAYTERFWWFESFILVYKLAMTVLILFVSGGDMLKILFGMLGATAFLATLAFLQPFKHPDILSINTCGQMVVLLVLFMAQYLTVAFPDGGAGPFPAFLLVCLVLLPLVAGVVLTLRLPKEALSLEAGDSLMDSVKRDAREFLTASNGGSFRQRDKSSSSVILGKGNRDTGEDIVFSNANPIHAAAMAAASARDLRKVAGLGGSGHDDDDLAEDSGVVNPVHTVGTAAALDDGNRDDNDRAEECFVDADMELTI